MIYLDNAATYNPKSARIAPAIAEYLNEVVASPGRGSHRLARRADEVLHSTRLKAQQLFSAARAEQFHFCANATQGLNFIIQGVLEEGDHVVTTAIEHNSTLRPLKKMALERNVQVDIVPCNRYGVVDPLEIIKAIKPETKLVVMNHASNVLGTVLQIQPVIDFCHTQNVLTLVDASQTAGLMAIDLNLTPIDFMVATGHKALRGPSGTGLIFTRSIEHLKPTLVGGTGGNSISLHHPQNMQMIFEAGTPNYLGIAGLNGALSDVIENPIDLGRELDLAKHLENGLAAVDGGIVFGSPSWSQRVPIVSFNLKGFSPQEVLARLDDDFDIAVRAGLHCAPIVHQMIGTAPHGTVRASLSHATTQSEINALISAVSEIAASRVEQRIAT